MAKKNRKKPKQPSKPLYPLTNIKQDTRNIAARTSVLTTVDTLLIIFSHLPQSCLLLEVQGTCQLWKDIIRRMPETFLENVPNILPNEPSWPAYAAGYPHLAAYHGKAEGALPPWLERYRPETIFTPSRWLNPILFRHFSCLYGIPDVGNGRRRKAFLNLHACYASQGPSSQAELSCMTPYHLPAMGEFRAAFKRPTASWRGMQLAAPPITKLRYARPDGTTNVTYLPNGYGEDVYRPDGIRMGDLFDLVVDYGVCEVGMRDSARVEITWAQETPEQEQGGHGASSSKASRDGALGDASLPGMGLDEIYVTRTTDHGGHGGPNWLTFADITRRRLVTDHLIPVKPITKP